MKFKFTKTLGLMAGLMLGSTLAMAQSTSTNRVAEKDAWGVYEDKNPTECWVVSEPKETVNTRNGRVVAVKRGDIFLMAFFRPAEKIKGQLAFTGGYPFAKGSTVSLDIDGADFDLFTEGEWAWAKSATDDRNIVTALKLGSNAILTARSSRGTVTKDKFSLAGFTAAFEDAEKRCK
jgi:invasion protein IalB